MSRNSDPKRILFLLDDFFPITSAGAVRILSFIEELRDHAIEVLGGAKQPLQGHPFPFEVHTIKRPSENRPFLFLLFAIRFALKAIRLSFSRNYQAYIFSIPKYETLAGAHFMKRSKAKIVVDVRDSITFLDYSAYLRHFLPAQIAQPLSNLLRGIASFLFKASARKSRLITAANKGILKELQSIDVPGILIENGVDTERFRPKERTFQIPLNLVYVGNFAEKDSFDYIFQVLPKFDGKVLLHLIGEGRNKSKITQNLSRQRIQFVDHGLQNHEALPHLLEQMHIGFIFRVETAEHSIPAAIYEFCSMNIPTVTNRVGLSAEFVEQNGAGKVVSSIEEFDEFLRTIVASPDILRQFSGLHPLADLKFSRKTQATRFREQFMRLFS